MKLFSIFNRGSSRVASRNTHPAGPATMVSTVRPLALEQRFMFDGAAATDAAHVASAAMVVDAAHDGAPLWVPLAVEVRAGLPAQDGGKKEVVLVDTSLANYQSLEAVVRDGVAIVEFDGSADGLAQIAAWAAGQSGLDAIHIFSHGSDGQLYLGSTLLTNASLPDVRVQAALSQLGSALQVNGDLLLYGCDLAHSFVGQNFLQQLSQATGADVAASSDTTGSALLGGNWALEYSAGSIEANVLAASSYQGLLATTTFDFENVPDLTVSRAISQTIGADTLVITAKDANLMVSTEINIFGVDASNASGLMLATGEGGNDLETQLTLSVSGGKIFDLTGFTLATIDGQNLVLKLTTSKGSETFTFSWANNSWSFSLVNATHPEYFTGVTEVVITEATGAQFIWGLDNIALSNIGGNTNAPPTTTVSTAGLSADTGTSSSDFITNTASQTITGTLSAVLAVGEKVQVSYDNGSTWSDASTYSVGSNSWTATTTLSGSNTFQARVANASGFSVAYTHSYALDTTAPTITFSNLSLQTDTGSSNSDFITNIASQNINATLSSTPGAGDVVTGSLDGGATWTDITSKVSGVTLSWNGVTISGSNTLMLKVVDAAGNDGSISSHAYTLDTMAPTTTVASVSFSNDTGISGSDFITNTASQTISGTLSANLQLGETVWVSINGGTTWTAATATVGQNTWSLAGVTLASSSTLCVKVTDTAGNDGTTLVRSYTYDTTAPTITFSGLGFSSDSGAAGDFITNTPSQTITGTLSTSLAVGDVLWGSLDGGATWTDITSKASGTAFSWNGVTLAGSNTLQLRVADAAGNYGTAHSQAYVLDTGAPAAPSTPVLSSVSDTGTSSSDQITNDTTPTFTGTAESGSTVNVYDGGILIGSVVATGGVWSCTASTLGEGGHSITATATDAAGNVSAVSIGLVIKIDTTPSAVTMTAVPASGTYYSGDELTFSVNFDEAVMVDTTGGVPRIAMVIGSTTRYATYVSGSGTNVLRFSYTVTSGDADVNGITVSSLSANGATLRDTAGNNATLTLNSVGNTANVLVDGTQASVTSVSSSTSDGSYKSGNTITITVDFSRAVAVDTFGGVPTLSLSSGGTATYSGGSGTSTLTFTYIVGAGQNSGDLDYASINALVLNGAVISDAFDGRNASLALAAPGSAGSLGANKDIVVDTIAPTTTGNAVIFSSDTGSSSFDLVTKTAAQTISGTLTANLVTGESVQVSLDNGFTWATASASPGSPNWSLAGQTLIASDTLKVRVVDAAGNVGTAASFSYVLDTTVPTVVITSSATALKAGESATLTFTFSEAPSGFTLGAVNVSNGTLSNFTATSNPLVYTAVFTPTAGLTGSSGAVSLGAGTYTDMAGNAGVGGISAPIAIDTAAPSAVISSSAASLKAGETAVITFTFSEAPQGFDLTDVTVMGGALSGFAVTANPLVYTAIFTPAANVNSGLAEVSINAGSYTDAAGNLGQSTSSATIHYDTGVPTTTVYSVQFSDDTGASASDLITNISAQTISGTLSTNLVTGESVQVSLDSGATWAAATVVGSDWTLSGQTLFGSGVLQVRVADSTGNSGPVYSAAYILDQSAPTVVISSDVATVNGVTPALITFTFSEAPVGFSAAAISVAGGTLGALTATSDPKVFTATFTPNSGVANGSAVISVNTGSYTDAAGNAGTAGMLSSLQIDMVAPTATPGGIHFSNDSGVRGDFITNVGAQTISGSLSAPLAQGDKVLISLDGGASWITASASGTNWSASATLHLGSNTLQVKVSDSAGNEGAILPQAYVYDTTAPSVVHVDLPVDGAYGVGQRLDFTVHFSEAVIVDTSGGTPRIEVTLDTGGIAHAEYLSGSGTSALVFRLVVASGQQDNNGITVGNSIQLNRGSLRDLAGNDGAIALTPGSSSGVLVDGVVPTVADVIVPANGGYKAGDVLSFTVNASEAVFTSGSPRLAVDIGGTTRYANFLASSSGGSTLVFQYTVQAGDNDADGISVASSLDLNGGSVKDAAGNDLNLTLNSVGSTAEVVVDTVAPSVTSIVRAGGSPSNSGSVSYTVTFSEDVSGVDASDFDVTFGGTVTGTLASVIQVNGHTYTVVIDNLSGAGNVTLSLNGSGTGIVDAVDNAVTGGLTGETYAIDRVAPAVTSVNVPANGSYIAGQNLDFTVNFSENVIVDTSGGTPRIAVTLDIGGTVYAQYLSGSGGSALVFRLVAASGQLDTNGITLGSSIQANGGTLRDTVGNNIITGLNSVASTTGVLVDAVVPTVSNVSVPAGAAYNAGDTLTFTVNISETVLVNGVPRLLLDIGGSTVFANLVSGSGTSTLVFQYTVQAGDNDADGISVSASLDLNGGSVRDAAGNNLVLTLNGLGATSGVIVDTVRPTATIVVADTSLAVGETSLVTITFSEAVDGFDNSDLSVNGGTLSAVSSSDGGVTWTATFTPTANITATSNLITLNNAGVTDKAGNAGSGATDSNSYAIDTLRPTATIVVADTSLAVGETSLVTITFSEAVNDFTNADLTVANGTLSNISSSDGGITWTATFTPTANITATSNLITLNNAGVTDKAGNAGSGATDSNSYAIDTLRPTATIVVADTSLAVGETSLVTITFSEAVDGFDNSDLSVNGGTLSAVSSSDGGTTWTATFTPTANLESTVNRITLNNAGVADKAGNAGVGATDSNNYAIDTLRPTATIVVADTSLAVGETSLVTIIFSEAVNDFTNADLSVSGGTLSTVSSSDGGITWTATFTPTANLESTVNLITLNNAGVTDKAGNAGVGTTDSNNYAVDTLRPMATIAVADAALQVGETTTVTITFSEAVNDFTNADLTVANGTLSNISSSDGGITWTATFTPTANITDATNLITLDNSGVTDAAGNVGSGTTDSNNYAIDTQRPTATIAMADTALKVGETSLVTITFSEAVSGFSNADLTIANGTLSAVSSSDGGITWTATFTPTANTSDATNLITLDNSRVTDAAGNVGSGTTDSNNYAIDTQRPTATIVVADTSLAVGETSLVTITFSEAVNDFTNADLSVSGGTLSAVSSSDGGVTWTAIFTPTVNLESTGNLITLDNSGVADAAGNVGSGTTDSNNYAIDTQRPTATIAVADTALKVGETSLVTITFSEAVSGFSNADLTIANGTLSAVSSSDGGITWTATFTPTANTSDATNLITLDNSRVTDAAGNVGSGTTDSNNYAIDTQRPTATIVVNDTALAVGESTTVIITFSEAVTGLDVGDFIVENGSLSNLSSSDGGLTWTATLTPTAGITNASNLITLNNTGYVDAAGNAGTGATDSNSYAIDTQRPTATIVVSDTALAAGETTLVTITFSEAVSGFDNSDLTVSSGTLSTVSSSDGGITWTATFTPAAGITSTANVIMLNNTGYVDAAGNAGTGTTDSNHYAIDTQRPTATIVVNDTALAVGESSTVIITFSEAVTGLDVGDFSVEHGALSNLTSSDGGITWTVTLTPTAGITNASNLITLNNTGYVDAAGNSGTGTTASNVYAIDTLDPVAPEITLDQATLVEGRQVSPTGLVIISGLEAGGSWQYSLDNGASWLEGSGNSVQLPGLGAFSLWVQQKDAAGNASRVTSLNGIVEPLVPPAVQPPGLPVMNDLPAGSGLAPFQASEVSEPNADFLRSTSAALNTSSQRGGMQGSEHWSGYGVPQSIAGVNDWMGVSLFTPTEVIRSGSDPVPEQFSVSTGASILDLKPVLLASDSPWDIASLRFSFADRQELPAWVRLDRHTGQLTINAPKDLSTTLVLQIKVSDGKGHESVRTVKLVVGDARATSAVPAGRAGLSEKMAHAAHQQAGKRMSMYVHG